MPIFAEIYRNNHLESQHHGHAVVIHAGGDILLEIGDGARQIFPRSSCKMIQALPLLESGAAKAHGLTSEQLALACASHNGEEMHVNRVQNWLSALELGVGDLRCGPQWPSRKSDQLRLHDDGQICTRAHNNCSGKHSGFLTLNKHLGAGSEYHEIDHPVQMAVREAFEEMTKEEVKNYGIDGCGAPNFMCSVQGLARAAANFANADQASGKRGEAMQLLNKAMRTHPLLLAGTNRACSELISASDGRAIIKTGAEAVYLAIIPERQIGIALKIEDGSTRASECAIAALLVRLGVVEANHPMVKKRLNPVLKNFNDDPVAEIRPGAEIWQGGKAI